MKKTALLLCGMLVLFLSSCKKTEHGIPLPADGEWIFVALTADEVGLTDEFPVSYVIAEHGYVEVEQYEVAISPFYWENMTERWHTVLRANTDANGAYNSLSDLLTTDPENSEVKIFSAYYERDGERFCFEATFFEGLPVANEFAYLRILVKDAGTV